MQPSFVDDGTQGVINVIPMNFRVDHKLIEGTTDFKEVHQVDLVKKGSNGEATAWNIKELKQNEQLWSFVEPHYDAWMKGQEMPTEGTPIEMLAFLTPGIVQHMKSVMIRTAEDLAGADENQMGRIGMGARKFKQQAAAYLESKVDGSALAAANEKLASDNEQLRAEMDELREQVRLIQDSKKAKK